MHVSLHVLLRPALAMLLAGCVGLPVRPDAGSLSRLQRIHLVPMETPPLVVDAAYAATGSASLVHFLPRYTPDMARAVGVLSGIVILLELPEMMERASRYDPGLQRQMQPVESWQPSVEIARAAARQLSATRRAVSLAAQRRPVPGVQQRGRTFLMENWMAPIRAWYNDRQPPARDAALARQGVDAVLEVGLSNYEVFAGRLLLQVHVKLLDPATGRLLGRARAYSFTELPAMDAAFAGEARVFKQAVARQGGLLAARCLRKLGL